MGGDRADATTTARHPRDSIRPASRGGPPMFTHTPSRPKWHLRVVAPLLAAIVAGAVVAGLSLASGSTSTATSAGGTVAGVALQRSFVNVVQTVSPSVVQIEDQIGLGSGIVFDSTGDIVTNNHVVSGGKSFTVATATGKRYPAKLVRAVTADDPDDARLPAARRQPATDPALLERAGGDP